ncbi:MAG: hypothetical protein M1817_002019 [Caeruleum heppii]|nr:MAG: hypothetical protein M1817_002019 [Caeruleum heppii]
MHILTLLSSALLLFFSSSPATTLALPVLTSLSARQDNPTTYPSEAEIQANCNVQVDKSVFFMSGAGERAISFARATDKMIYRDAFPENYTFIDPNRPEGYPAFVDRFSRVYASMSIYTVWLVAPWDADPASCTVWKRIEEPALKANRQLLQIIQVNPTNFAQRRVYWSRTRSGGGSGARLGVNAGMLSPAEQVETSKARKRAELWRVERRQDDGEKGDDGVDLEDPRVGVPDPMRLSPVSKVGFQAVPSRVVEVG